jgi:hypothetical protein
LERGDRLYCEATGMDFSPIVADELAAVADQPPAEPERSQVQWGGRWRCPADAKPMVEQDGLVRCPRCGRSLPPRLLYGLIEFHDHPRSRDQ